MTTQTAEEAREAKRLSAQKWREENRERHRAYTRQYRAAHKEIVAAKNKEWAAANPDKMRAYHAKARVKNKSSYRQSALRWRAKNPHARASFCASRRAKIRGVGGIFTRQEWTAMLDLYDHKCLCCGRKGRLTRDHVIPIDKGGRHEAANIQPLCLPCNSKKGTQTIDYRPTRM